MKSLLKSRTFWLAILQAGGGLFSLSISGDPTVTTISGAAIAKSALDIALRLATTQPVGTGK